MTNPFQYGSVVTGEAFCNRKQELKDVVRAMQNGDKLFIYAERRSGKTSLIQQALAKLPKTKYLTVYVDLWPTDTSEAFVTAVARAVTTASAGTAKTMLNVAQSFFQLIIPSITLSPEGKPRIEFGMRHTENVKPELEEVLAAPPKIAAERNQQAVIVLDECQQILQYESDLVERQLRSIVQFQEKVSYVFLGSRKHLIQKMFLEKSRPLYRSAGHYPLPPIQERDWIPFIQTRFTDAGKDIEEDAIHAICRLTQGHPFYTQHLCHALWELAEPGARVSDQLLQQAVDLLLDRENFAYTTLWDSLSRNQQRFLKGLANEGPHVKPFSSAFTRRYGLRSASNAQRAAEGLLERDVIDPENGSYGIVDRFLRIWIQRFLVDA
jgi:energy-coupling factor transporter ATP-binding protein EcfA2